MSVTTLEMCATYESGEKCIRTWTVTWTRWDKRAEGLRASCESELRYQPKASRIAVYKVAGDTFFGEEERRTLIAHADRPPHFDVGDRVAFQIDRRDHEAVVKTVIGETGRTLLVRYDHGDVRAVSAYECSILGARKISEGGQT